MPPFSKKSNMVKHMHLPRIRSPTLTPNPHNSSTMEPISICLQMPQIPPRNQKPRSKRGEERARRDYHLSPTFLSMEMGRALPLFCLLALTVLASKSQAQDSSCLNQLVPCLDYVSSRKNPPSSCCDPLKSLIKSDPQCLCSMLSNKSLTQQGGVNMSQAQGLPSRCGVNVSPASCSGLTSSKPGTSNSPSKSSLVKISFAAVLLVIVQIFLA